MVVKAGLKEAYVKVINKDRKIVTIAVSAPTTAELIDKIASTPNFYEAVGYKWD